MNFKRKLLILFLMFLLGPLNTFALSKYLVPGGENLGITIRSDGILVVGFYETNNPQSDLKLGDLIVSINDTSISYINDMIKIIDTDDDTITLEVGYKRNNLLKYTTLKLTKDNNGVFKTGLYVKDSVTGIGTLTFIDPSSNRYGALGHSITDSKTNIRFDVKNGQIFKSEITGIDKSRDGYAGEKNAKFYFETVYGTIDKNLETGIYGTYNEDYSTSNLLEVGSMDDIKIGKAYIRTTLTKSKIEEFEIEVISVDKQSETKNILFQITDQELIRKTGGIVRGMSGSPIIQDNKIIGAVTHTVISDNTKGYGISIIKMLESME